MEFQKSRNSPDRIYCTAARNKRGRPPSCSEAERSKRILQAAEHVFATIGYGAATMEEIAHAAGMSKKTIYGLYPDKNHLLVAVTVAAEDFPWDDKDHPLLADPVAELRRRLLAATEFAFKPRQIRLTRLLIAEAGRAPELADYFHRRLIVKFQRYVAAAVERAAQEGVGPKVGDATLVTKALLGAAINQLHLLVLFGKLEKLASKQIVRSVDIALEVCGFVSEQREKI